MWKKTWKKTKRGVIHSGEQIRKKCYKRQKGGIAPLMAAGLGAMGLPMLKGILGL